MLFTIEKIEDDIGRNKVFHTNCYYGMAEKDYQFRKFDKGILTEAEVEEISEILRKVSMYSYDQKREMMEERMIRSERGDFSHPYQYYFATTYENGEEMVYLVRDNGYYQWVYLEEDDAFLSFPTQLFIRKGKPTSDFNEILNRFHNNDFEGGYENGL